jgi:hypothetical protein
MVIYSFWFLIHKSFFIIFPWFSLPIETRFGLAQFFQRPTELELHRKTVGGPGGPWRHQLCTNIWYFGRFHISNCANLASGGVSMWVVLWTQNHPTEIILLGNPYLRGSPRNSQEQVVDRLSSSHTYVNQQRNKGLVQRVALSFEEARNKV